MKEVLQQTHVRVMLGLYMDNGEENGNYYNGLHGYNGVCIGYYTPEKKTSNLNKGPLWTTVFEARGEIGVQVSLGEGKMPEMRQPLRSGYLRWCRILSISNFRLF